MYDIADYETFSYIEQWMKELRCYTATNIVIVLVGNKCDLSYMRAVPMNEARQFAGMCLKMLKIVCHVL